MRTLDAGCGIDKLAGAIGIDRNPASRADVLCDLDHLPYPFLDSSFDRLRAVHVIEHVANVIRSIEEFYRLVRAEGAEVGIVRRDDDHRAARAHRWHLNSSSLGYFSGNHGGFGYWFT